MQTTHLAHPQKLPETACLNPRTILLFTSFSATHAGNYCVVTFAERRSGPDARVPYNADITRLIPGQPGQDFHISAAPDSISLLRRRFCRYCPLRPCRTDAARENPPKVRAVSPLTGRGAHHRRLTGRQYLKAASDASISETVRKTVEGVFKNAGLSGRNRFRRVAETIFSLIFAFSPWTN